MSLVPGFNNQALDDLIQSSLKRENKLKWIPYKELISIEPTRIDNVYYASRRESIDVSDIMLILVGRSEECTSTLVSELDQIYSLPTHNYNNYDNNNFKRYKTWLRWRNRLIYGFTEYDDNYYMVASRPQFQRCYSRYGYCSACGILRYSPVWCACGHKQLSNGWTSNNTQLDGFIKKSQLQTNSANDAYLEWIPFDCIYDKGYETGVYGLPTPDDIKLIPLEITDETDDSYYDTVTINTCILRLSILFAV